MNRGDTIAGVAFAALGLFMIAETLKAPYLLEGVPGPAFLPRWLGIGLIATGAVIAVNAMRVAAAEGARAAWPDAVGWRRVALMLGALAVSLLVLEKLGFLLTTTFFVAVVIFGLGVRSWLTLVSVPLIAAIGLYVVFAVWLSVPLPKGVLEFLSGS